MSWTARSASALADGGRLGWRAAEQGAREFYESHDLTFAASIAFYALLSLFPFILLVLAVLDRITVGAQDATLLEVVVAALPSRFDFLITQIHQLAHVQFRFRVVNTLVLLWAAMGVFGALTSAINHAWDVEEPPSFFKHKLIAFVMLMAAGALMMATLLVVSTVQVAQANWFTNVLAVVPGLASLRGLLFRNAPLPMFVLVVGLIYYYAPNVRVRLRDVWLGAVLAGLLWRLAFAGFAWYVRDLSRFSVHGQVGAVVAFLLWVYLSAVIILYGAEVSAAYARQRREATPSR